MSSIKDRALTAALSREKEANRDWSRAAIDFRNELDKKDKRIKELEAEKSILILRVEQVVEERDELQRKVKV